MSVPSMVHRLGDTLVVRSVVSGSELFTKNHEKDRTPPFIEEKELPDLPDCKVKRNYSCSSCDYFTQNPRHHLYHMRDVHKEKVRVYECSNCLYASKHFQKLLRHSKMVHGSNKSQEGETRLKRPLRLPVTAEEDDTSETSGTEEAEPVKPVIFKCSVCAFTAKSRVSLTKHEKEEHIKTKFFRCTKCTYVTHMKARFTKHVKYHSMPMIKCDTCDFRTPYKWNLDRHCKNHNGKGAFRCSACNFTADIKQSLTVHEMNHHVPPVGQAAGFGIGRRRNKVGASDTAAAEEASLAVQQTPTAPTVTSANANDAASTQSDDDKPKVKNRVKNSASCVKRPKTTTSKNLSDYNQAPSPFGSDFINPDDIIHHANGNVYFKNKCKLCNFKSAWDSEMTKHEAKVHNIIKDLPVKPKKTQRPIPNLIPIPMHKIHRLNPPETHEPVMSQKDFNEICAKSTNSALKDFASLMDEENIFKNSSTPTNLSRVPDLIPASLLASTPKNRIPSSFKQKNASFFDQLKEKLMTAGSSEVNLTCSYCGHQSKCLTEQVKHQKLCGTETNHIIQHPNVFTSSSRCQYCRQRCKSSLDLYNHLQTCLEAQKTLNQLANQEKDTYHAEIGFNVESTRIKEEIKDEIKEEIKEEPDNDTKVHPMENRVFVWNNIEVPMDIDVDDSIYEYTDDKGSDMYINEDKVDDNMSLDLSIRTHSPGSSECSYIETESMVNHQPAPVSTAAPEKIPTHGTDISVAQHKRVFQCPHCTFWASTASRFHVHIVGHLNKKPFECSLCSYRSNWRWDITKHIKLKSVRDPAHESAKVLMTDETGRRNYTKYNKYLTEIHVGADQSLDTSGGSGTRPRGQGTPKSSESTKPQKMPPITADFNSVIQNTSMKTSPPSVKLANGALFDKTPEKKRSSSESKRTLFKCKKCNFRDASRAVLLQHVKGHYTSASSGNSSLEISLGRSDVGKDERHCRLKHGGDIRVVSSKNGQERLEVEEQTDEPDHIDVVQTGTFKCKSCPFSNDNHVEFEEHLDCHISKPDTHKCHYCNFYVSFKEDLVNHLALHGVTDPEDFMQRLTDRDEVGKRFRCLICPYVTNSKSQYTYHKQFHKPRGGQYSCTQCSYNVSKRHLLHQHLKVHGINVTPHRQNGEAIDMEEISEEIEEVPSTNAPIDLQSFPDIPLVWVSKNGKFTKMFKCRYCPHVNLRKVNIQEHEKMHSIRERNPNSKGNSEVEHHCSECNYVCNNAGVLSSHSKVHQGLSGTVHCLVDPSKSDEEQITELSRIFSNSSFDMGLDDFEGTDVSLTVDESSESTETNPMLHFCCECPARFLKENEYLIHTRFHGVRLFYKCEYCSYTSRQKPHLLAHNQIHSTEYQERTKVLQDLYPTSAAHKQPQIFQVTPNRSEPVWIVYNKSGETDDVKPAATSNKPRSLNVPLSGTDLFQQKYEAEQKCAAAGTARKYKEPSPPPQKTDPQFGILMHGNPNFIYPTTVKNGKMKEKRYKCPTCPSAFEKREQYKIHLGLHGSKQRYRCDTCDYSVKYYANYVQHKKKHAMNDKAQADKNPSDPIDENEDECEDNDSPDYEEENIEARTETVEATETTQSCSTIKEHLIDEKRLFYCHLCPYANYRKDAVDNHSKRHISMSGIQNAHTCTMCDYSVPQQHFLRDHLKLHSVPVKTEESTTETLSVNSPRVEAASVVTPDRFNNNEGEKEFNYDDDDEDDVDDKGNIFARVKTEN